MDRGTELDAELQKELEKRKVEIRIENEKYLRENAQLHTMLDEFFESVLKEKPVNPSAFAVNFFSSYK
jgi:hypothetical protein